MVTTHPTDFLAGRDLAVELLREAELTAEQGYSRHSIEAQYRAGAPQSRFVLPYLQRLVDDPRLLAGFAAVLSDELGGGTLTPAELYAGLDGDAMGVA